MNPQRRTYQIGRWLLYLVVVAGTLSCGAIEAVYRYGLTFAGALPQRPPQRELGRFDLALWAAEEGTRSISISPQWPWVIGQNLYDVAANLASGRLSGRAGLLESAARTALLANEESKGSGPLGRTYGILSLSVWISRNWSAEDTLRFAATHAWFGRGAYGVEAAAQQFFAKPSELLTWAEAALLAGLLQAPQRFDPACDPVAAMKRRDFVLKRLRAVGFISEEELQREVTSRLSAAPSRCQRRTIPMVVAEPPSNP